MADTKLQESESRRSTANLYSEILGLPEIPMSVDGLPKTFSLPAASLGDLESAILDTSRDKSGHYERAQNIYWNKDVGFKKSRLLVGSSEKIVDAQISGWWKNKALVSYHTHPPASYGYFEPSISDITYIKKFPRDAFVHIIGSYFGILAIVQTREAMKTQISSTYEGVKTAKFLTRVNFEDLDLSGQAKILKELKLGLYVWEFNSPNFQGITKGILDQGITLNKVN